MMKKSEKTAYLSNVNDYISFTYGDKIIRFKGPYSLQQINKILTWDRGYLVVMAKYSHTEEEIEDYIDLVPILENLYIDVESFLNDIENVEVQ